MNVWVKVEVLDIEDGPDGPHATVAVSNTAGLDIETVVMLLRAATDTLAGEEQQEGE